MKARDAPPRHTPLSRPMLIAPPLACRGSAWTTRTGSSLSWWPCARSAASTSAEPLQPRPGGEGAGPGGTAVRARQRASQTGTAVCAASQSHPQSCTDEPSLLARVASTADVLTVVRSGHCHSLARVRAGEGGRGARETWRTNTLQTRLFVIVPDIGKRGGRARGGALQRADRHRHRCAGRVPVARSSSDNDAPSSRVLVAYVYSRVTSHGLKPWCVASLRARQQLHLSRAGGAGGPLEPRQLAY